MLLARRLSYEGSFTRLWGDRRSRRAAPWDFRDARLLWLRPPPVECDENPVIIDLDQCGAKAPAKLFL
jgi:hypothetical protein